MFKRSVDQPLTQAPADRSERPNADGPIGNLPEMTVGELSGALKRTIEDRFGFVRVRGEISNYRGPHSSGHAYFCLKDESARIDAVIWKTTFLRLKTKPQEGLEVVATGRVTTFPGKSTYQIVIEAIEPAGVGALMAILETRRRALAGEGLFDDARKRPLPFLPRTIGVVTSPTGAVIRDILHRIGDRFPRDVLIWPVRVQGDTAAAEIAAAISGFNALPTGGEIAKPELMIVARGGGSLEDLWAFNEEIVIRAAAASTIPLIAAVGHETDWTLIDHVADLRAPTPSGAAEKAVPVRSELLGQQADLSRRHRAAMVRLIERYRSDLRALARVLPNAEAVAAIPRQGLDRLDARLVSATIAARDRRSLELAHLANRLAQQTPHARLAHRQHDLASLEQRMTFCLSRCNERRIDRFSQARQRLANVAETLGRHMSREEERWSRTANSLERVWVGSLSARRDRLDRFGRLLETLGYRQVLARGFALVRDRNGRPIRRVGDIPAAAPLDIEFTDGHIEAVAGAARGERPARASQKVKPGQGSLF